MYRRSPIHSPPRRLSPWALVSVLGLSIASGLDAQQREIVGDFIVQTFPTTSILESDVVTAFTSSRDARTDQQTAALLWTCIRDQLRVGLDLMDIEVRSSWGPEVIWRFLSEWPSEARRWGVKYKGSFYANVSVSASLTDRGLAGGQVTLSVKQRAGAARDYTFRLRSLREAIAKLPCS